MLNGFKSFHKNTVIPLYPGFNAVIGPNASGKSNLLDAITFVLGRRSKSLRAGRMDHLLFNGGHGRSPADSARVSIFLDNNKKILPLEGDEVEVSRRVGRTGLSTYRLNGKLATKAELDRVLRMIHVSADGHNIIQQGDITKVIQMRPLQRREIIDEVSGIKEYAAKRDRAERELHAAQKKVDEANVIMEQKREFLGKLRQEKNAAEKFEKLASEQDYLLASIAHSRVKVVESLLENVSKNLEIKEKEGAASNDSVGGSDLKLEKFEKRLQEIEDEMFDKSTDPSARADLDDVSGRMIRKQAEIESKRREIERLQDAMDKINAISGGSGAAITNKAVQAVLDMNMDGCHGTVSSLSRTDPKFQLAIETAAGAHLNDIIIELEKEAIKSIERLRDNNLGRARFLPLDRLRPFQGSAKAEMASKMAGIVDYAVNLVKFDQKFEKAFRAVLRDTLVAENNEAARRVRGVRVVTLDGSLFEAGGAITGGSAKRARAKMQTADVTATREYEKEIASLDVEIGQLKDEIGELNQLMDEKKREGVKESEAVVRLRKEREKLRSEIEKIKKGRKGDYESSILLNQEIQDLRVRKARLEAELDNLLIPYEKYKDREGLKKDDPEKLQKQLDDVQRRLRNLGQVNQLAIQDFEEMEKNYNEFKGKLDKLVGERDSVIEMIKEIEEKRKKVFRDTLRAVAKEFVVVYEDMVGGQAGLSLEDPNDIESGLAIMAQPPEKELKSIDSLSGGEKTLAAIAFLFAILRYRPSPFYILDEIDAALDPENSVIVGDLIRNYSDQAQFLVISHNEALVQKADRIYGISMRKGASQILGVELDK